MGVAKVPPPRPSTAEPDHAPQTIFEDASLMPPRDKRPSVLMSARSHVLIDSASIPCSSASSPPPGRRLASGCTSSSDGPRQKGAPLTDEVGSSWPPYRLGRTANGEGCSAPQYWRPATLLSWRGPQISGRT